MPALTGQGKLPVVMLSKELSSLMDVENYTDEYNLGDTLTTFKYSAGLPGAGSNSFMVDITVINPAENFERALLPNFRTLFSQHSKNSNLQEGASEEDDALQFYVRWGYGSTDQGMSKIVHGYLNNLRYAVTADGERTVTFSLLDHVSFALSKYPEFAENSSSEQIWEYEDIIRPDGGLTFPSVVVEDLLSQMTASLPNSKGHVVLGSTKLLIDNVWLQLTDQLATGFGTQPMPDITAGPVDYPIPLPQDLIRMAERALITLTGQCQWVTPNDNLKINVPGSYYAAQRIAYDMIMKALGIKSGGGEIGETRSDATSAPKNPQAEVPTVDKEKYITSLNEIKLDNSYLVYEVGENGYPEDTGKSLGEWLDLYRAEPTGAVSSVFKGPAYMTPEGISNPEDYASHYGFPGNLPFRPGGYGYNGPESRPSPECRVRNVQDITEEGWFPLNGGQISARQFPSPGYYVALGPLNYDKVPPSPEYITGAGLAAQKLAAAFSTKMDEASDSAANNAAPATPVKSSTQDKPKTKYRASIVKGEFDSYINVLNSLVGNVNHLIKPLVAEEDDLLHMVPYFKSNLTTPNPAGLDLWGNLTTATGLTQDDLKDVTCLYLLGSKNLHKQALTNDAADDPSEISKLCAIQSFPSISTNLPTGQIKNVENGSITSLLLLNLGYPDSIVTDFSFDNDIFAPIVSNGAAQMYIHKLDEVWGKNSGGVSTDSVRTTFYYVLQASIEDLKSDLHEQQQGNIANNYEGFTDVRIESTIAAGVKTLAALDESGKDPGEIDMTRFLKEMSMYYTKYQRINQEGLFSSSEDTAERLNALFEVIQSQTFRKIFFSENGKDHEYVIDGKSIRTKSTPKWKLDLSIMSQIDKATSLSQFLRDRGVWDKGFAQYAYTATVTTLGVPELSSFVEDDAFRKINLQVSNPRLPEGPKHWTSGIYQILGYTHDIAAGSMYTTTFELLRQPFVEFN